MVTRCWCPKCGLFVPTGTSNVFKSNQPAAHGVASRIKSAYLRDVKRHHSAPRCFCWTCCKVNERHAHDKSISKCRLMRVASWLKCPDCKLQRNSEPLLKLNSCTKGGKKIPSLSWSSFYRSFFQVLAFKRCFGILASLRRGV